MFYSKYSNYAPDQIIDDHYENQCKRILSMVEDGPIKEKIIKILYEGGFDDFSVNGSSELVNKDNSSLERSRRISMAYLLATNPETFEIFEKNKINLFHGTNFNALPNILKYGMQSVQESLRNNVTVSTGEWSIQGGERDFISFTNDLDIALWYSSINSATNNSNLESFGIIIGISSADLEYLNKCKVGSDIPELGIKKNVPLEYIKVIAVPKNKVEFISKLVGDRQIIITPINSYEEEIELIYDKKTTTLNKVFTEKEAKQLASTRKMSGIRKMFDNLLAKIKGEDRREERG